MNTILLKSTYEYREKKSLFIAIAFPIKNKDDFLAKLNQIKEEYPGANHYCFAYRILVNNTISEYFSDDGEPSNSAGKPILNPIKGRNLINTAVVVVRYFGGIKLGIGGLVHAYSYSTSMALSNAKITEFIETVDIKIETDYTKLNAIKNAIEKYGKIIHSDYSDTIVIRASIPQKHMNELSEQIGNITKGKGRIIYE